MDIFNEALILFFAELVIFHYIRIKIVKVKIVKVLKSFENVLMPNICFLVFAEVCHICQNFVISM